ncbi:MAG: thiamine pyrophosphate-binding protein [Anaeroplasmataceae bacterium]
MKMRVADYIVKKLSEANLDTAFCVVGGGSMNLNDAFGHSEAFKVYYNHHEQASSMACEGYARIKNKPAVLVVTTGPGGINALNGVCGAYLDSVPMIVLSGQIRWDACSLSTSLPLRAMGDQEFNIVGAVKGMTKYADIVVNKNDIRYMLEKAIYLANNGRKGPTWLDIPGDVQSSYIETDELLGYEIENISYEAKDEDIDYIINKIKESKRPIVYAGSAIRSSGSYEKFLSLIDKLNVPVVTAWNAIDAIPSDHPLCAGRPGNFGDRYGNFAVQNSDLIISLGCRLSIRQVGFNYKSWAPKSHVIMVDIDKAELLKPTIHVEYPICADVYSVIDKLNKRLDNNTKLFNNEKWMNIINGWKQKYPLLLEKFINQNKLCNAYYAIDKLSREFKGVTVASNGTACVVGSQMYHIGEHSRFIENSAIASMGYGLPAAFGASIALGKEPIMCFEGDGSIQMNIQELQTIIHHNLPIRIVVFNNDGYHSIRQSQSNFFKGKPLCGVGPDSLDLSFPDMEKIAYAYGYSFNRVSSNKELDLYLEKNKAITKPEILEVMVDHETYFQPKAGSMKLSDGSMVSAPLENLAPYLPKEEIDEIMKVSED